jgi:hypothetical protein
MQYLPASHVPGSQSGQFGGLILPSFENSFVACWLAAVRFGRTGTIGASSSPHSSIRIRQPWSPPGCSHSFFFFDTSKFQPEPRVHIPWAPLSMPTTPYVQPRCIGGAMPQFDLVLI